MLRCDGDPSPLFSLMRRDVDASRRWAQRLREIDVNQKSTIVAGALFEVARLDDDAVAIYDAALADGHYPVAHVGLARIALHRGNKGEARRHALNALNVERPVPPAAADPVVVFADVLAILREVEEQRVTCVAWMVAIPPEAEPYALADACLMVHAPDREGASVAFRIS